MARHADHPIEPFFIERWSPRAMSGEPVTQDELLRLFEAARWAPSSANNQPWRILYAHAGTPAFDTFFALLKPGNQAWCVRAGVLLVFVSRTTFDDGSPARTHAYDTGSAWMSLALQGSRMGLVVHGMGGFDYDAARDELGVPDGYAVQAMAAVGRPGRVEDLPPVQQAREHPNGRHPVSSFAFEGRFRVPTPEA